ncbi:hypothetical protein [Aeromonas phage AerS_266]|nr:hypothetical protein [Aeromonas phage AerS_266]
MKNFIMGLVVLMVIFSNVVSAKDNYLEFGWVPTAKTESGEIMKITNMGFRNGTLTVGCEHPGDPVAVNYIRENNSPVKMFIVELENEEGNDAGDYVRVYGLRSLTPAMALKQFELSNQGLVIAFYAEGALQQYYRYRGRIDNAKIPVPVGAEKFAGHENVKEYTDQIAKVCTGQLTVSAL